MLLVVGPTLFGCGSGGGLDSGLPDGDGTGDGTGDGDGDGDGIDLTNVSVSIDRANSGPAELDNAGGQISVTAQIAGLDATALDSVGNVVLDVALGGAVIDTVPVESADGTTYAVGYSFPRNNTSTARTYEIVAKADIDGEAFESGPYYVLVRAPASPPDIWRP